MALCVKKPTIVTLFGQDLDNFYANLYEFGSLMNFIVACCRSLDDYQLPTFNACPNLIYLLRVCVCDACANTVTNSFWVVNFIRACCHSFAATSSRCGELRVRSPFDAQPNLHPRAKYALIYSI